MLSPSFLQSGQACKMGTFMRSLDMPHPDIGTGLKSHA